MPKSAKTRSPILKQVVLSHICTSHFCESSLTRLRVQESNWPWYTTTD